MANWDKIIYDVATALHNGRLKNGDISPDMVRIQAGLLMQQCFEGYGKSFDTPGIGAADVQQLEAIEKNVYVFSGFKNYHQLKEASLLLKTSSGAMRPFADFFADLQKIDHTYNEVYARAEWQNAHNTSMAISRWQTYIAEADANPYLIWRTNGGENTCPVCGALNGTCLPVRHPFWRNHFFPAHFGCYCIVEQTSDKHLLTPKNKIPAPVYPDAWKMFNRNAGIDGVVFPAKHPYYQANEADKARVRSQAMQVLKKNKNAR